MNCSVRLYNMHFVAGAFVLFVVVVSEGHNSRVLFSSGFIYAVVVWVALFFEHDIILFHFRALFLLSKGMVS